MGKNNGKVAVCVGYTRGNIYEDYKWWRQESLVGADIQIIDGLGNEIQVNAREDDNGYRIEVNGETIALIPA